ncbi:DUF7662 domain-containing protein [Hyphobacterium indicum]|uniref:DUF7662 domain-containing protein n=1 Tax=Hyphobacterium indicum TaxID=2162714 RepID=UPI001374AE1B|nr:hypothetical protein [Hyphobacterium indicum]
MSKYDALTAALNSQKSTQWQVSFSDIESIIGARLPDSAYRYRAWWSNNPTNSVMTKAWLKAGWKSSNVDMAGRTLTFRKVEVKLPTTMVAEDSTADYEAGLLVPLHADQRQCLKDLADATGETPAQTAARLLRHALDAASPALRVRRAKAGLAAHANLPDIDLAALVSEAKDQH